MATWMPTTSATIYIAYQDVAAAPIRWEITNITCGQGSSPPAGAVGVRAASISAASQCHWLRSVNRTGSLESAMALELTASGLAEDRGREAYMAQLTYVLVYPGTRNEFSVPIFTQVHAVPVASRSVRGLVLAGGRCDNASLTSNSSGEVLVELGRAVSVPFSLCDLESYPTSQPESQDPASRVTSVLRRRVGAEASTSTPGVTPSVAFSGGARYDVELSPPALGSWELVLYLGDEQIPATANVTTYCPKGQVPMPGGNSCGCEAGTILKPGAVALLAAAAWPQGEELCEACTGATWSEVGAPSCEHCKAGYYLSGVCRVCPSEFAECEAFTTLATLHLKPNTWRLSALSLDFRSCVASSSFEQSPCVGGSLSGTTGGSGYCKEGYSGPLCRVCNEANHHYVEDSFSAEFEHTCVHCGGEWFWMTTLLYAAASNRKSSPTATEYAL